MNIAKYSLENTKVVYFFLAILLVGGVLSFDLLGKKGGFAFCDQDSGHYNEIPGSNPERG